MPGVDEVDDAHTLFSCLFAVQATGILLQRALPRDRHRQHEGVEWRVIEAFADQPAAGQQHAWSIGIQCVQGGDHARALLLRLTPVQKKQGLDTIGQCVSLDSTESVVGVMKVRSSALPKAAFGNRSDK